MNLKATNASSDGAMPFLKYFLYCKIELVRDTAQENVMNEHRKSVYSFLWLINLKI
jgi:hypothetical protein